jgi:hypothetical protein
MKIIIFLLSIAMAMEAGAQTKYESSAAADLMVKSRKQKTAAWVLLGSGAVLSSIGLVVGLSTAFDALLEGDTDSGNAGGVLLVAGLAGIVGSVPLFMASAKNARKSRGYLAFKLERSATVFTKGPRINQYPAIAISIRL